MQAQSSAKFPAETVLLVMEVVNAFEVALDNHLFPGTGDGIAPGAEVVASEQNPTGEPL